MKVTAGPPTTLTGVSTTENFALAIAIAWTVAPAGYERVNSVVGALTDQPAELIRVSVTVVSPSPTETLVDPPTKAGMAPTAAVPVVIAKALSTTVTATGSVPVAADAGVSSNPQESSAPVMTAPSKEYAPPCSGASGAEQPAGSDGGAPDEFPLT